jgi:hypothetical protein
LSFLLSGDQAHRTGTDGMAAAYFSIDMTVAIKDMSAKDWLETDLFFFVKLHPL